MNGLGILERPVISEKGGKLRDVLNQYLFRVDRRASKAQIKGAIEKKFNVKVARINTLVVRGQTKRRAQLYRAGRQKNFKKAYITLEAGEKIALFEDN